MFATQVTNLANASSLVFNALQAFPEFGTGDRMVNWCGASLVPYLRASPSVNL